MNGGMKGHVLSLAKLFIRETLYLSITRRTRLTKGLLRIVDLFLPNVEDNILIYNLKWFIGGLGGGFLISLWIPILSFTSRLIGYELFTLFVISYLTMLILVPIILVIDFIHQLIATVNELRLISKLEYLPIPRSDVEKAASYSILIGGGLALLLGMGVSSSIVIATTTGHNVALVAIPLVFVTSMLLTYPIVITIRSILRGKTPTLVSLVLYVALIVGVLALYFNVLSFGSVSEAKELVERLKVVFPFPYLHVIINKPDAHSVALIAIYTSLGLMSSIVVPSKLGLELAEDKVSSKGRSLTLNFPRIVAIGLKDLLLILRDHARQKQFYAQATPLLVPFMVSLLNARAIQTINVMDPTYRLVMFYLIGVISYISATLSSPTLLFVEGDRSYILYFTPLRRIDIVLSKTIASTIMYAPVSAFTSIAIGVTYGSAPGALTFISTITYWITGSFFTLLMMTPSLEKKPIAWTEFSINVWKRLLIDIILFIPIAFLTILSVALAVLGFELYALLVVTIPPVATSLTVFYLSLKGSR